MESPRVGYHLPYAMPVDAHARARILRAAQQWRGKSYDYSHGDMSWQDLRVIPPTFDCSTFVCRVAMEAMGYRAGLLAADAGWLLDHLAEVDAPKPGDLVGYGRPANDAEAASGRDVVWHVMIYLGHQKVIGACDIAGKVVVRPIEYQAAHGDRQWQLTDRPYFRVLELRKA